MGRNGQCSRASLLKINPHWLVSVMQREITKTEFNILKYKPNCSVVHRNLQMSPNDPTKDQESENMSKLILRLSGTDHRA